jgi:alanine dehydrogenase
MALLLSNAEITESRAMSLAISAMEGVYRLPPEDVGAPVRVEIPTGRGWLRLLAATIPGLGVFGYKAMNLVPGIGVRYAVFVYSIESGELLGIVDAQEATTLRTGACSALATRHLVREDPRRIAIIGSGIEARAQLYAMHTLYPAAEIAVHSRHPENRVNFTAWARAELGVGCIDHARLESALVDADVVVLATKSSTPVLNKEMISPGMHVNSVGSARKDQHELAGDAFPMFWPVVCDSPSHVLTEAGDAAGAVEDGTLSLDAVFSLSQLVRGELSGRAKLDQPTLYKSVGTATQDVALAQALLVQLGGNGMSIGTKIEGFPDIKSA